MAKVKVYNSEGKEAGDLELNDAVFAVKLKESVVHQVYVALMANARKPWAHTKTRGEVRGGGRKPWRQKGTGRARHGSIRSPIWKGGGVTFGPRKIQNYKQKINKKMNQSAVRMCLSDKVASGQFVVLEELASEGKTKPMAELRAKLPGAGRTTLVLSPKKDEKLTLSLRNIPKVDLLEAKDVSVVDLLNHQYVILPKKAIAVLEKRLT